MEDRNLLVDYEEDPSAQPEAPKTSSMGMLGALRPWQRFALSLLLFLDVAVVGFLFLVILGYVHIG
ncbi:MAG: hypothetical protein JXB35_09885 [Anaerolineae bacterium]|nr:hypothetical protein [Anaerolineae bacterium]